MMSNSDKLSDGRPITSSLRLQRLAEVAVEGIGKFCIENVATVGRSPDSHIVLDNRSVSRHHARFFFEGGHFWIKDLDSRNGITVNGQKSKLQMLNDGDKVTFGEMKGIFRTSAPGTGPAPIGRDPLEGSDPVFEDGTPTGGLKGAPRGTKPGQAPRVEPTTAEISAFFSEERGADRAALPEQIQSLKSENESLKKQIVELKNSPSSTRTQFDPGQVSDALLQENERLRRQVAQLERALADSNLRLRNLQARLDQLENPST